MDGFHSLGGQYQSSKTESQNYRCLIKQTNETPPPNKKQPITLPTKPPNPQTKPDQTSDSSEKLLTCLRDSAASLAPQPALDFVVLPVSLCLLPPVLGKVPCEQ